MSRAVSHVIVQLALAAVVAGAAALMALILAGTVGGVAIGVAPEATFGLVEGVLCLPGTELRFSSVQRSYHQPGESEPHLECVGPDGQADDVLLRGISAVLGLAFAACFALIFVPVFIPLSIVGAIVTHKVGSRGGQQGS